MKVRFPLWLTISTVIIIDKIIKAAVIAGNIPYYLNQGISFGIGKNNLAALLLALVFLGLITWLAFKFGKKYPGLWFVLAGGIANFSDRVIWGGIIDYVQIANFPVFNLADIILMGGVVITLTKLFFPVKWKRKSRKF